MNLPLSSAIPIIILLKDCNSNDDAVDDNHTWNNFYICEPLSNNNINNRFIFSAHVLCSRRFTIIDLSI